MAVAGLTVLISIFELAQNEKVHKGLGKLWERTKWGKDRAMAERADAFVERYIQDVRGLAMTIALPSLEESVTRRSGQLQSDLAALGTPANEASALAARVRQEVEESVINPTRELRALTERLEASELSSARAEETTARLASAVERLRGLASMAMAVAFVALVLAAIVLVRS